MKKIYLLLALFVLCSLAAVSQFPSTFKYQAVARDASGNVLANQLVSTEIQILQGAANGTAIYTETHDSISNGFGLVNLSIGSGNPSTFQAIEWGEGPYFVSVSVNNVYMGASELASVPYAMHAKTAETVANFSLDGNEEAFEGWDKNASDDFDGQYSSLSGAPTNVSSFTNDVGYLTSEGDGDPENEIQNLYITGQTLSIGGGNWVIIPDQVRDPDDDPENELQELSLDGSTLSISDGNSVTLPSGSGFSGDYNDLSNKPITRINGSTFIDPGADASDPGRGNIALGNANMQLLNSDAENNIAIGIACLAQVTTGSNNIGIGNLTGYAGNYSIGIGTEALENNYASHNIGVGYQAGHLLQSGSGNVATGGFALSENVSGEDNVAIGYISQEHSTASRNVSVGSQTLHDNTSAGDLVAIGYNALTNNGTSSTESYHATENTAVGSLAMENNTNGFRNSGVGYRALQNNTSGYRNAALGVDACLSNTSGYYNVGIGSRAIQYNQSGWGNIGIGYQAGPTSGNTNLANTIAIGSNAQVTASNTVRIGNENITTIEGQVAWSNPSDRRLKENIETCELGLNFITEVETVNYTLKADESQKLHQGVIAQDIEALCEKLGVDFTGLNKPTNEESYYSVSYSTFVVPLINAVQELETRLTTMEKLVLELSQSPAK